MKRYSKLDDEELKEEAVYTLYWERYISRYGNHPDTIVIKNEFISRGIEHVWDEVNYTITNSPDSIRNSLIALELPDRLSGPGSSDWDDIADLIPRLKNIGNDKLPKKDVLKYLINEDCLYFEVTGDSMIDKNIHDGDLIVVCKNKAKTGDVVCVRIGSSYLVKTLIKQNGYLILRSENDNYKDYVMPDDVDYEIVGTVKHVISAL